MQCYKDLEGKIPAKDGDRVALIVPDPEPTLAERCAPSRRVLVSGQKGTMMIGPVLQWLTGLGPFGEKK